MSVPFVRCALEWPTQVLPHKTMPCHHLARSAYSHNNDQMLQRWHLTQSNSACCLFTALSALHSVTKLWPSKCRVLSKNLILQMEKQHLLSYSFTYGSHNCSYEPKQVCRVGGWPLGTLNRGPGPGDTVGPRCSEGHAVPNQMNLHMK